MKQETNTNEVTQVDTVAQDFKSAVIIVSLVANLAVFTTWLTVMLV